MYEEDYSFAYFTPERAEYDDWEAQDQGRFHVTVVQSLAEYRQLISAFPDRVALVDSFAQHVSYESFRGLNDGDLAERGRCFARELMGQPLPVTVKGFISGLSIADPTVVVSDRLVLRRPTPEDVAEYKYVDEYGGFTFPALQTWFSVVGEFVFDALSTGAAQLEFLKIIEALCLYRVGGVAANRYEMRSKISGMPGGTSGGGGYHSRFKYALSGLDAAGLNAFLGAMTAILPHPFELDGGTTEKEIALARYMDALLELARLSE
jgi:hypothetical protein